MFEMIVGALALGGIVMMGIDKTKDVIDSVRNDGVNETIKKETKSASNSIKKKMDSYKTK